MDIKQPLSSQHNGSGDVIEWCYIMYETAYNNEDLR